MVGTPQQSMRLTRSRYPSVIISASGMATGGRVLHHLKAMAPNPRNHIVFPGFQVGGTRGAKLVAGATEVKIFGEYVPVRAQVSHLEGFSGHADADELMAWLRGFEHAPRQTFVVHGDPKPRATRCACASPTNWAGRCACRSIFAAQRLKSIDARSQEAPVAGWRRMRPCFQPSLRTSRLERSARRGRSEKPGRSRVG